MNEARVEKDRNYKESKTASSMILKGMKAPKRTETEGGVTGINFTECY